MQKIPMIASFVLLATLASASAGPLRAGAAHGPAMAEGDSAPQMSASLASPRSSEGPERPGKLGGPGEPRQRPPAGPLASMSMYGPVLVASVHRTDCFGKTCNCTGQTILQTYCHEEEFGIEIGNQVVTIKTGRKSTVCATVPIPPDTCISLCYSYDLFIRTGFFGTTYTPGPVTTNYVSEAK